MTSRERLHRLLRAWPLWTYSPITMRRSKVMARSSFVPSSPRRLWWRCSPATIRAVAPHLSAAHGAAEAQHLIATRLWCLFLRIRAPRSRSTWYNPFLNGLPILHRAGGHTRRVGGGGDSIQAPGHSSLGGRLCAVMGGLPAGMAFSNRPTDDSNESSGRGKPPAPPGTLGG